MNKLVIAEKPMLGRDIARAICGKDVSESARLPISGNGYTVVACAGHLLELIPPDEVNTKWGKPWKEEALPICIHDWPKKPAEGKENLVKSISDLLDECDSVINAGDPDDEGQLIVDEVLDYLGYAGKVERVYVNDNIEKNILKAFSELKPNLTCKAAGDAAYARQMADAAFGFSESRLASIRLHGSFPVGRVQTPTLGLVVARDEAISNHTVRKFYELNVPIALDDGNIYGFRYRPSKQVLMGEKHVFDKGLLDGIKASLDGSHVTIETNVAEERKSPPLPYNLTVLLAEMSRRYGYSATETQDITQRLRDNYKAITYNRTDSQYLKSEHHAEARETLSTAMRNLGVNWNLDYSIRSKAFNDKNVTAHHGLIPQDSAFDIDRLSEKERNVYTAIVERYAMQFLPPALYDVSTSIVPLGNDSDLIHVARMVKDAGWKGTFGNTVEDTDEDDRGFIQAGKHNGTVGTCKTSEKETTPPKPYTEGTLITDMASIAKYVKDPNVVEVLKRKDDGKKGEHGGIGTTATRASIIERLKKNGYIESKGKKLVSTAKGRDFIHTIPEEIVGADVTAKWWLLQEQVAEGDNPNIVQDDVCSVFDEHKAKAYLGVTIDGKGSVAVGDCPKCSKPVVRRGKIMTCTSNHSEKQSDGTWKQTSGCGFKTFGSFFGKPFTDTQCKKLLSGERVVMNGLKSSKGSTYAAYALMSDEENENGFTLIKHDGFVDSGKRGNQKTGKNTYKGRGK